MKTDTLKAELHFEHGTVPQISWTENHPCHLNHGSTHCQTQLPAALTLHHVSASNHGV